MSTPSIPVTRAKCSILVVDDEPYILSTLKALLSQEFDVLTAKSVNEAKLLFQDHSIEVVLSDQRMPGHTGVELLEWVRQHHSRTMRLLMTGFAELEEAIEAINRGQVFRYIPKPWKAEELLEILRHASRVFQLEHEREALLAELRRLNAELEARVQERTVELEKANNELELKNKMLEKLALTDPLTSLPNRRAMDRLVERELRRRERYPSPIALGLIDVDHFKHINTQFLLPGGDKVLVDLARCLSASLRTVDCLGRIGGEEFLLIASETNLEGAMILAERIRINVQKHEFHYKEHLISVTVSIGFAVADVDQPADFEQMKHLASRALAEAKDTGRNRCVVRALADRPFEPAGYRPAV